MSSDFWRRERDAIEDRYVTAVLKLESTTLSRIKQLDSSTDTKIADVVRTTKDTIAAGMDKVLQACEGSREEQRAVVAEMRRDLGLQHELKDEVESVRRDVDALRLSFADLAGTIGEGASMRIALDGIEGPQAKPASEEAWPCAAADVWQHLQTTRALVESNTSAIHALGLRTVGFQEMAKDGEQRISEVSADLLKTVQATALWAAQLETLQQTVRGMESQSEEIARLRSTLEELPPRVGPAESSGTSERLEKLERQGGRIMAEAARCSERVEVLEQKLPDVVALQRQQERTQMEVGRLAQGAASLTPDEVMKVLTEGVHRIEARFAEDLAAERNQRRLVKLDTVAPREATETGPFREGLADRGRGDSSCLGSGCLPLTVTAAGRSLQAPRDESTLSSQTPFSLVPAQVAKAEKKATELADMAEKRAAEMEARARHAEEQLARQQLEREKIEQEAAQLDVLQVGKPVEAGLRLPEAGKGGSATQEAFEVDGAEYASLVDQVVERVRQGLLSSWPRERAPRSCSTTPTSGTTRSARRVASAEVMPASASPLRGARPARMPFLVPAGGALLPRTNSWTAPESAARHTAALTVADGEASPSRRNPGGSLDVGAADRAGRVRRLAVPTCTNHALNKEAVGSTDTVEQVEHARSILELVGSAKGTTTAGSLPSSCCSAGASSSPRSNMPRVQARGSPSRHVDHTELGITPMRPAKLSASCREMLPASSPSSSPLPLPPSRVQSQHAGSPHKRIGAPAAQSRQACLSAVPHLQATCTRVSPAGSPNVEQR